MGYASAARWLHRGAKRAERNSRPRERSQIEPAGFASVSATSQTLPPLVKWMTLLGAGAFAFGIVGYGLAEFAGHDLLASAMLIASGIGAMVLGLAHRRARPVLSTDLG